MRSDVWEIATGEGAGGIVDGNSSSQQKNICKREKCAHTNLFNNFVDELQTETIT